MKISELKDLAEKATPTERVVPGYDEAKVRMSRAVIIERLYDGSLQVIAEHGGDLNDAKFIAATGPGIILSLIERNEELATELQYFIERVENIHPDGPIQSRKTYARYVKALSLYGPKVPL